MPFLRSDYRTASLGALVGSPSRRVACARVLACVTEETRKGNLYNVGPAVRPCLFPPAQVFLRWLAFCLLWARPFPPLPPCTPSVYRVWYVTLPLATYLGPSLPGWAPVPTFSCLKKKPINVNEFYIDIMVTIFLLSQRWLRGQHGLSAAYLRIGYLGTHAPTYMYLCAHICTFTCTDTYMHIRTSFSLTHTCTCSTRGVGVSDQSGLSACTARENHSLSSLSPCQGNQLSLVSRSSSDMPWCRTWLCRPPLCA